MVKWEYSVKKYPINDVRQATELLSVAGNQGWELVWAVQSNQDFVAVLKREQVGYAGPREKRLEELSKSDGGEKRGPGRPPKNFTSSMPALEATFPDD